MISFRYLAIYNYYLLIYYKIGFPNRRFINSNISERDGSSNHFKTIVEIRDMLL